MNLDDSQVSEAREMLLRGLSEHLDEQRISKLGETAITLLANYLVLLHRWNQKRRLVGSGTMSEHVQMHLCDILQAESFIPSTSLLIDLGSGAGIPGMLLAITRPNHRFVLVDSRDRSANFLKEVRSRLGLSNVEVLHSRIEDLEPQDYNVDDLVLISRAFSPASELLKLARSKFPHGTRLFYLGGVESELAISADSCGSTIVESIAYSDKEGKKRLFIVQI